jgi:hypothetical protein
MMILTDSLSPSVASKLCILLTAILASLWLLNSIMACP